MPRARKEQVSLDATPYYHCTSRCVRRAFLCGLDEHTGQNYSHRKQWIVKLLEKLSDVFAIDICAYAIMSNHYHVVLHVDKAKALEWTDEEVVTRWQKLFPKAKLIEIDESTSKLVKTAVTEANQLTVATWRKRLMDISWFMRCINEKVAREANKEDNCTGRFFEGRFKSQALVDEAALLACMAYVDLNPIRAGISQSAEESNFTSIQRRIRAYKKPGKPTNVLMPTFDIQEDKKLPITSLKYIELVEWTGKNIIHPKKASIPSHIQSTLTEQGINADEWLGGVKHFGSLFYLALGKVKSLKNFCKAQSKKWLKGQRASAVLFSPT